MVLLSIKEKPKANPKVITLNMGETIFSEQTITFNIQEEKFDLDKIKWLEFNINGRKALFSRIRTG